MILRLSLNKNSGTTTRPLIGTTSTLMNAASRPFLREIPASHRAGCHCLNISSAEIESAIDTAELRTVKEVIRETGAGSGCTACHCTIRALLEAAGRSLPCAGQNRFAGNTESIAVAG
jgi:bacterioferritin-associated ferredoxin